MSSRFVRGPLVLNTTTVVTTGDLTVTNESCVVVDKTVGAATAITLPAAASLMNTQCILIKDGKGDAATNNITITPASGTIDGAATYVISSNYGCVLLQYNSTQGEWGVALAYNGGGSGGAFAANSITGTDSSLGITGLAATGSAGAAGGATAVGGGAAAAHTTGTGGAGGAVTGTGGVGGAATTGVGGAGGGVTLTGGAGGATSAGTGAGGAGGTITLAPGAGGSSFGGSAGARGRVKVSGAILAFANAQTIDMADAAVALTLVPGTPSGTSLVSNVLFVDPNSGQATENLDLPPEADCNGLVLHVFNTGGEGIVVRSDGGGTIITLDTAQHGVVACDGTSWRGFMGNIT